MEKNILILGAPRTGKTTLAKKLNKEFGYNILSIDDLVSGFEAFPSLNIKHDSNDTLTSKNLNPFLKILFKELSEGSKFYDDIKYVIEGTHIDVDEIVPYIQSEKYKDKYDIIGITMNKITEDELFNNIKSNDTEDDWTYWVKDEDLKGDVRYFIEKNRYFNEKFKKYNIRTIDTSIERENEYDKILKLIK